MHFSVAQPELPGTPAEQQALQIPASPTAHCGLNALRCDGLPTTRLDTSRTSTPVAFRVLWADR
jgi:hypothetical protein